MTCSKNITSDQKIHVAEIITCVLDNSKLLNAFILMNFEFLFFKFLTKLIEVCFNSNDFSYNF